jgi:hypothetical protein
MGEKGEFSESNIDAEDYFNLLLSPARPRRYVEQLGVECDSEPGDEDENDEKEDDTLDESPLPRRSRQPSAQPSRGRRGRRGPAPGTGGRPRKSRKQAQHPQPPRLPRRYRSPVMISPEQSAVFHAQNPVWNGDLDACALTDRDKAILREFWTQLDNEQMQFCGRCQERWFQMNIDSDGICARCYRKDDKRRPDEPYFFSADNQLDFGTVPTELPQLTPIEESLIARVHVHVNIMLVRGQQYKYRGHVVHFLREVGLVYHQLPLLPQELNTVLLRPANTSSHAMLSRQFTRQFRVRRQPVTIWLNYLRRHHPGYRCIVIDEERLSQLPEDGNVLDAIPRSQVEATDVGPEDDQEAEPDLEDEVAVPDLLAKDTELDALRTILAEGPEDGPGPPLNSQTQVQHGLELPNIRHTPNKYNGPVFLTTLEGKKIVPILPVERDFLIGATLCARTQFPLITCYPITVHKPQSITEDMIVTDLSCRDFQTGLSYVAVSRVKTLEGLMLDAPFDRNHLVYGSPPDGMKMKMRDQELRKLHVLTRSPDV